MVFVKKHQQQKEDDLTIAAFRGVRTKTGHVGLEVEVESNRPNVFPKDPGTLASYWNYHRDNSLRGADNGEYVLERPINFDKVDGALDALWKLFRDANAEIAESNRTSVHVHLNVLPFYQNRLVSLAALWFIFEEVLSMWCGDHRVGNLFAIRAKDGQAVVTQLKKWIEAKGNYKLNENSMHYAAFNSASIQALGSVEVRTLRGATEPEVIKQWVRILKCLYDASDRFADPRTIVETFSYDGPTNFFHSIFGELAEPIRNNVELNEEQFQTSLYEGIRYAQDLVFARDWSDFNPTVIREDPFGRQGKPEPELQRLRPGEFLNQLAQRREEERGRVVFDRTRFGREWEIIPQ